MCLGGVMELSLDPIRYDSHILPTLQLSAALGFYEGHSDSQHLLRRVKDMLARS